MIIKITDKTRLRIAVPLRIETDGLPQLELRMPKPIPANVTIPATPPGYILRSFRDGDEIQLISLFKKADFSFFDKNVLDTSLAICLPGGCFVIEEAATKTLVSTMMARHLASPEHPFGGRIDWLATDPEHRGAKLGQICAASATQHLITRGYKNIWVTTDEYRTGALKIFLSIGFKPLVTTATKERWDGIFKTFNLPTGSLSE